MTQKLTVAQQTAAERQLMMGSLLSPDLTQAMMRASIASVENLRPVTDLPEFLSALYLQAGENVSRHFSGDLDALVQQTFPKHRKGVLGSVPEQELTELAEHGERGGSMWHVKLGEDLLRVLWNSARLSRAVGKTASLLDFIAAIGVDASAGETLRSEGIALKGELPDFNAEFHSIILSYTFFASDQRPTQKEFHLEEQFTGPFSLEVHNPSGRFMAVKEGRVLLNGEEVASVSEETSLLKVQVLLQAKNTISVVLKGKPFECIETIIRGTPRS